MQVAERAFPAGNIPAAATRPASPRLNLLALLGQGYTFVYILLAMSVTYGAFVPIPRFLRGGAKLLAGESDVVGMVANILVLLGLFPALWSVRHKIAPCIKPMLPYGLIIGLCIVSSLWSPFPLVTFRKSVNLGVCVIFGAYLFLRLGFEPTLRAVLWYTVFAGVVSVLLYFGLPDIGKEHDFLGYENALRGVYAQKNVAGEAMMTAQMIVVYLFLSKQLSFFRAMPLAIFFFGVEILSMSASATVVTLLIYAAGLYVYTIRKPRMRLLTMYLGISLGTILFSVLLFDPQILFGAVGRDASLTGRIPLWLTLIPFAKEKFLLGWGYAGFFNSDLVEMQYIWKMIEWNAPNAHNGYLDIILQIGVIGLALYGWVWSRTIYMVLKILRRANGATEYPVAIWGGLFMLVNIALNIDEGPLPYQDEFTMLMPLTILSLEGAWRDIRIRTAVRRIAHPLYPSRRGGLAVEMGAKSGTDA